MGKVGPETVRRSVITLATLAALITAAVASAAPKDTTLSVIGYSIPTAVFPKLQTAYQATSAG